MAPGCPCIECCLANDQVDCLSASGQLIMPRQIPCTSQTNIARTVLFSRRHLHSMHPRIFGAFGLLPAVQNLRVCYLVYFHPKRTGGRSHLSAFVLPTPVGKVTYKETISVLSLNVYRGNTYHQGTLKGHIEHQPQRRIQNILPPWLGKFP